MAGLQYKNQVEIVAGGYPGEWKGSDGTVQDWVDVLGTSGQESCRYYYHDSWPANNAISSRVWVTITDQWEIIETTSDNHIKVRVRTSITKIERMARGSGKEGSWNSLGQNWAARWGIKLFRYRESGNNRQPTTTCYGDYQPLQADINQVILNTPVTLDDFVLDLPPQTSAFPESQGTVFYQSAVVKDLQDVNHENDDDGSQYVDRMWMGINFRNTLPPDYRPGQILDNNSMWQSHNRTSGADNIYTGSIWQTMRTSDGAVGQNNPPLIRHTSSWYNERKIGANK